MVMHERFFSYAHSNNSWLPWKGLTFMQPVYDELNELFDTGMSTYDASRDERFQLYATILHTVSDYPGTGILPQYSVMG